MGTEFSHKANYSFKDVELHVLVYEITILLNVGVNSYLPTEEFNPL